MILKANLKRSTMFESGQLVCVNLAGLQAEGVMFQAAVTDAVAHIGKQTAGQPKVPCKVTVLLPWCHRSRGPC